MTFTAIRHQMPLTTVAENMATVRAAAQALGRLGDPEALWSLMDLAEARGEPDLVGPAAEAIGRIGTEVATQFLSDLALDGDPRKRACSSGGLEILDDPEATEVLWSLLRDDAPEVRRRAVLGLGRRPLPEVEPELRSALLADGEGRRAAALEILRAQLGREGVGDDDLADLARWATERGKAAPESATFLAPVSEALEKTRTRMAARRVAAKAAQEAPPASPAPAETLAAECAPDGVPIYRPLRHRVLAEGEGLPPGAAR